MNQHPAVQAFVNKKYGPNQIVKVEDLPYWSRVRFAFSIAGVLAVSTRQAFAYGINDDMAPAGFAPGRTATMADTNLQKKGETVLGADVLILGVTAFQMPTSDPALAARVVEECALTYTTDGQRFQPLARLEMIPAGGGFVGGGQSAIKTPAFDTAGIVDGGEGANQAFINNGVAAKGNYFPLRSPVLWSGERGADSFFRINLDIGRQISEAVAVARAAAAGVAAYTPPVALGDRGTFVDYMMGLVCVAISLPSKNG